MESIKLLEGTMSGTFFDIIHNNIFFDLSPKARKIKAKINKWDVFKGKNLHRKGNHQQNEKTTYYMGKNICQ